MAEQTKKQCFIDKCKKQEYEGRSNCNGMCSQHFKENWGTIPKQTNQKVENDVVFMNVQNKHKPVVGRCV
jgi:hypothetical protein